jgi:hypothetical protein
LPTPGKILITCGLAGSGENSKAFRMTSTINLINQKPKLARLLGRFKVFSDRVQFPLSKPLQASDYSTREKGRGE